MSNFDDFDLEETLSEKVVHSTVPNQFPSIPPTTYRLAIIGDFPHADDVHQQKPFVGMAGQFLSNILSSLSILRACCYLGNVHQTPRTKFDKTPPTTDELTKLHEDLAGFKPNLCLLLGRTPLILAKATKDLDAWRGSMFVSETPGPFAGYKCLASYHPRECLRNYDWTPLLTMDLRRAAVEARSNTLTLPQRDLITNLPFPTLLHELTQIQLTKPTIACDIEGGINTLSCISIATSPHHSFLIPFTRLDGTPYWDQFEEGRLWKELASILSDPSITKIWQNGLYDRFVLQYSYAIVVRNSEDIMLAWWELYCELKKSLGFQCSILTSEPFYKSDRKTTDQDTFYKYCCRDSAVTFEIHSKLKALLQPKQHAHYLFNNTALNFLLYAELRGIRYNQPLANERLQDVEKQISGLQNSLDSIAADMGALRRLSFNCSNQDVLRQVNEICCYKKNQAQPKKEFEEAGYHQIAERLANPAPLTPDEQGEISILCGLIMNSKSTKFKDFLYETCGLPVQYKKDPITRELRPTTDYEALLKLSKTSSHPVLGLALDLSRLRTRAQMLAIRSHNGRMHCSYNLVGTETGRITSSKSILPSYGKKRVGANLQTVPDDWDVADPDSPLAQGMRDLFLADEGCYIGKADLKGADGWTIGAYMASIGDRTMLDDLLYGIKPAQVVAYILMFGEAEYSQFAKDRIALLDAVQCVKKDMWQYFVSKVGIWGYFYTMGPKSLAMNVFIQSEGATVLSEKDAREFQRCIGVRYNAHRLHKYFEDQIARHPYPFKLECPNGMTRRFFGRKKEILGEVLAHVPQVVTTHATVMAATNLWMDVDNRRTDGSLRVEILHQVHDELVMQWRIEDTEWAKEKVKHWFNNPMKIVNQTITIPYDGAYGTAWSMDSNHKIGTL